MATCFQKCSELKLRLPIFSRVSIVVTSSRQKSHGNLPTKRPKNTFIKRNTDFIKLLCIGLVKYERIQTTLERAKKLEKYGNLLIELTQRKQPPPDLFTLENGFLLRPDEITEKFTTRKLINRRWKKRLILPTQMSETEFVAQCRVEAGKILLQDPEAIEKLYGELADRYRGKYGGFVKITKIPNKPRKHFPWLAFVEYQDNGLPPLPVLPECRNGELYGRPRVFLDHELTEMTITNNADEKQYAEVN